MATKLSNDPRLAINGGPKARTIVSPGAPKFDIAELMEIIELWGVQKEKQQQIRAILSEPGAARSPHLFRYYGPQGAGKVQQLEKEFAAFMGAPHALAVNSGTSALIAALVACGIGPGMEVLVPAHTFFASAAAIVVAKAIPVLVEIDESMTMDVEDAARKITPQTRAILPVHMRGMACNMDGLTALARRHNLRVVEDCAQADGGLYKGKRLGTLGDCGCFSFDFYKLMATGEGGMVTSQDERIHVRAQSYHDTAACWRPDRYARERMPGELFCGENYRMSEVHGAMGLAQLRKLDGIIRGRLAAKKWIRSGIESTSAVRLGQDHDPDGGAGNLVFIAKDRDTALAAIEALKHEGVSAGGLFNNEVRDWHVYTHWEHILERKTATPEGCPFTCPYYKGKLPAYHVDMCPRTRDLLTRSFQVMPAPSWTQPECQQVADAVNKVAKALAG